MIQKNVFLIEQRIRLFDRTESILCIIIQVISTY